MTTPTSSSGRLHVILGTEALQETPMEMGQIHGVIPSHWLHRYSYEHHGTVIAEPVPATPSERVRIDRLEAQVQHAIDIGLENLTLLQGLQVLLEEAATGESKAGLGAIHSLDNGRVQLNPPLIYGYQVLEDEVVVGVEELRVYGVGPTESQALEELQEELWDLFQELDQLPPEELGEHLKTTLRILRARIHHALDA